MIFLKLSSDVHNILIYAFLLTINACTFNAFSIIKIYKSGSISAKVEKNAFKCFIGEKLIDSEMPRKYHKIASSFSNAKVSVFQLSTAKKVNKWQFIFLLFICFPIFLLFSFSLCPLGGSRTYCKLQVGLLLSGKCVSTVAYSHVLVELYYHFIHLDYFFPHRVQRG